MDEDYDELMGPRPGQDMRRVFKDDPSPLPPDNSIRRTSSSKAGPPPTLFHSMPDRWSKEEEESQAHYATGRKNIMSFEEEEADDMPMPTDSSPQGIRQEALRMLEVAESGSYSVHRTVTGGFMAEPRSMGDKKRVPTALAGLGSFASGAARSSKPRGVPTVYRDTPMEENYGYGDEYDDARFSSQQVKEEKKEASGSWSSRYSVDNTLLAMSGGSTKSNKTNSFLDKLDSQNERRSARNMFTGPGKDSKIFGSGFSFRQKNVFGQQGATTQDSNLRTVWMDAGASNSPARSWMDELKTKQNKRRKFLLLAALFCAFVIVMIVVLSGNNSSGDVASSLQKTGPAGQEALTFYVTSDTPWTADEDKALAKNVARLSTQAAFMVHLGSIQDPLVTQCAAEQYEKVANILMKSPVPVFVIPGQQDWNNCPDQDEGWFNWVDNFMQFDDYFDKDMEMMRQEGFPENFAFIEDEVLFIGVHETDGEIEDMNEVQNRNSANVAWIDGIANSFGEQVRAMVIFGNGRPYLRENDSFYLPLQDVLYRFNPMPIAYIHANDNDGDDSITYKPYHMDGMEHVVAIQSSRGGNHAPMRIHVGWDETNPFIVG